MGLLIWTGVDEPGFKCIKHNAGARRHFELSHNLRSLELDASERNIEQPCNLLVCVTFSDLHHITLALA